MILVNGQLTECISVSDRGFQYGDGCFTTLLITRGEVNAWAYHLNRLTHNTRALGIDGVDWAAVTLWVKEAARSLQLQAQAVLKVIITRGIGGRGYSTVNCGTPNVVISTHAYPSHVDAWREHGIKMVVLERRLGISSLAGLKHLNRLEQVLFRREIDARGADDGVVCDVDGNLVEASSSNLFWRKGQVLLTPSIETSGVAGTMRAQVIDAAKANYDVQCVRASVDALWDADEIFITNAVIKLISVRCIESKIFTNVDACKAISLRLDA